MGDLSKSDLLFPQMTQPDVARPDREWSFLDYLYVSNPKRHGLLADGRDAAVAVGRVLMLPQSAIALSTVALVIARAGSILRRLAHGPDRDVPSPHL